MLVVLSWLMKHIMIMINLWVQRIVNIIVRKWHCKWMSLIKFFDLNVIIILKLWLLTLAQFHLLYFTLFVFLLTFILRRPKYMIVLIYHGLICLSLMWYVLIWVWGHRKSLGWLNISDRLFYLHLGIHFVIFYFRLLSKLS